MDLTWTDSEQTFRAEARTWLGANLAAWREQVGGEPASGDTKEGFAQHLVWELMLFDGGWAVVAFAKERLANFKVPRAVEFADSLPRNLSGKVLKTQLRSG